MIGKVHICRRGWCLGCVEARARIQTITRHYAIFSVDCRSDCAIEVNELKKIGSGLSLIDPAT